MDVIDYIRDRIFNLILSTTTSDLLSSAFCQLIMVVVYTIHPGTTNPGKVIFGLSIITIIAYHIYIPFSREG